MGRDPTTRDPKFTNPEACSFSSYYHSLTPLSFFFLNMLLQRVKSLSFTLWASVSSLSKSSDLRRISTNSKLYANKRENVCRFTCNNLTSVLKRRSFATSFEQHSSSFQKSVQAKGSHLHSDRNKNQYVSNNDNIDLYKHESYPLHEACCVGDIDVIRSLLKSFEVDIHQYDKRGYTALHVACDADQTAIAEILIKEGYANVDKRTTTRRLDNINAKKSVSSGQISNSTDVDAAYASKLVNAASDVEAGIRVFPGSAPLHIACMRGNMPLVRMLLRVGEATPDITTLPHGQTPFICACKYGQLHTVMALVDEGLCKPQTRDLAGRTALHEACLQGHVEVVKYLLQLPVLWLEATDKDGSTPLLLASASNQEAVVKVLLKEGANVTHKDNNGATALSLACGGGHIEVARMLALDSDASLTSNISVLGRPMVSSTSNVASPKDDNGASGAGVLRTGINMDVKDVTGWTALHYASANGHADMVQVCLTELQCQVNMRTKRGETALHLAASRGHYAAAQALLTAGARVDVQHQYGRTPLHVAAGSGHDQIILLLVDRYHANANSIDDDGRTPLMDACGGGHASSVRLLLKQGRAKVNIQKVGGRSALHIAVQTGVVASLNALLEGNADIGLLTAHGDSALHVAALFGKNACIQVLLAAGADPLQRNGAGLTPAEVARAAKKPGAVAIFEQALTEKRRTSTLDEPTATITKPHLRSQQHPIDSMTKDVKSSGRVLKKDPNPKQKKLK